MKQIVQIPRPYKVIHKFRNQYGKVQYHVCIFIGFLVSSDCMKILNKITGLNLFVTLVTITKKEAEVLISDYGEYWYEYFFVSYHISHQKREIVRDKTKSKQIKDKYGDEWFNKHLKEHLPEQKIVSFLYELGARKKYEQKNLSGLIEPVDPDAKIDYRIEVGDDVSTGETAAGGAPSDSDDDSSDSDLSDTSDDSDTSQEQVDEVDDLITLLDQEGSANTLSPVGQSYVDPSKYNSLLADVDDLDREQVQEYASDIKEVLGDRAVNVLMKKELEFDESNDDNNFDQDLKNVYEKYYVVADFITIDDSIKNVKIKIFLAMLNSKIFPKGYQYLLPQFQYLWGEYKYASPGATGSNSQSKSTTLPTPSGKGALSLPTRMKDYEIRKVAIGYRWMIGNDMIIINNEPPELYNFRDPQGKMKLLANNLKSNKARFDDKNYAIVEDYRQYITMHEIFLVDILHEFGLDPLKNYDHNERKNIWNVFTRLYFPQVSEPEYDNVIFALTSQNDASRSRASQSDLAAARARSKAFENEMKSIWNKFKQDQIVQSKSVTIIEETRQKWAKGSLDKEFDEIFEKVHVVSVIIRLYLIQSFVTLGKRRIKVSEKDLLQLKTQSLKFDLQRIYLNFKTDATYPFAQYKPIGQKKVQMINVAAIKALGNAPGARGKDGKLSIIDWFGGNSDGLTFKIFAPNSVNTPGKKRKYVSINLNQHGKVDYKVVFPEAEKIEISDIVQTHSLAQNLIAKINRENVNNGIKLEFADIDEDESFTSINTIQKFSLPILNGKRATIDHNDLSDFARCFYSYFTVVIDPKKRESKNVQGDAVKYSKSVTDLRWNRVSGYDDPGVVYRRIKFFYKHNTFELDELVKVLEEQFNITDKVARLHINQFLEREPKIKKARNDLKKLETIGKYNTEGIYISIQGVYKIKIMGTNNKVQLQRISSTVQIFVYLYIEIYIKQNRSKKDIADILQKLVNIAKRRHKVRTVVAHEVDSNIQYDSKGNPTNLRKIASLDSVKLYGKIVKWARRCQQSGKNHRRQPQIFENEAGLLDDGYKWVDRMSGEDADVHLRHYEKTITWKGKKIILKAIKVLAEQNDVGGADASGDLRYFYYACSPKHNGKYMYLGFLNGDRAPCCFKLDKSTSKDPAIKRLWYECMGLTTNDKGAGKILKKKKSSKKNNVNIFYIIQNEDIPPGRYGFLPEKLGILFNDLSNLTMECPRRVLLSTKGYYFKYGISNRVEIVGPNPETAETKGKDAVESKAETDPTIVQANTTAVGKNDLKEILAVSRNDIGLINGLAVALGSSPKDIVNTLVGALKQDVSKLALYTSLGNGAIRRKFGNIQNYIDYVRDCKNLDYEDLVDLICSPGILHKVGVNLYIIKTKNRMKKVDLLEKEQQQEYYYIHCVNKETIDYCFDQNRINVVMTMSPKYAFDLVVYCQKEKNSKKMNVLNKTLAYDAPVMKHLLSWYKIFKKSNENLILTSIKNKTCRDTCKILRTLASDLKPMYQVVDDYYKCMGIICKNHLFVPVFRSGCVWNLPLIEPSLLEERGTVHSFDDTRGMLGKLAAASRNELSVRVIGVYYNQVRRAEGENEEDDSVKKPGKSNKTSGIATSTADTSIRPMNEQYRVHSIMIESLDYVPITPEWISKSKLIQLKMLIKFKLSNDQEIDAAIKSGVQIDDERIIANRATEYRNEMYQLLRYHMNYYFTRTVLGAEVKKIIKEDILDIETSFSKKEKRMMLKQLLYHVLDARLLSKYQELVKQLSSGAANAGKVKKSRTFDRAFARQDKAVTATIDPQNGSGASKSRDVSLVNTFSLEKKLPINVKFSNVRVLSQYFTNKVVCNQAGGQYNWNDKQNCCQLSIREDFLIEYINRLTEELVNEGVLRDELFGDNDCSVSDIVNYTVFTERPDEVLISNDNMNIATILKDIFANKEIETITSKLKSKQKGVRTNAQIMEEMRQLALKNNQYAMLTSIDWHMQQIFSDNLVFFRALANCYFFKLNKTDSLENRNLKYYSDLQTRTAIVYKANVLGLLYDLTRKTLTVQDKGVFAVGIRGSDASKKTSEESQQNPQDLASAGLDITKSDQQSQHLRAALTALGLASVNAIQQYIETLESQQARETACKVEAVIMSVKLQINIVLYDALFRKTFETNSFPDLGKYAQALSVQLVKGTGGAIFALYPMDAKRKKK